MSAGDLFVSAGGSAMYTTDQEGNFKKCRQRINHLLVLVLYLCVAKKECSLTISEFKRYTEIFTNAFKKHQRIEEAGQESEKENDILMAVTWDFQRVMAEAKKSGIPEKKIKQILKENIERIHELP